MGDEVRVGQRRPAQLRRQRPDALTAIKRQRFLDMLAATANVERSAAAAEATPGAFYQLKRRDAVFAAAWSQSLADSYVALESQLLATALGTTKQPEGVADRAEDKPPFDARLALDVLRRRDAEARGPATFGKSTGCKHVAIADVERSLIAKLEALERRLSASGAATPPVPDAEA